MYEAEVPGIGVVSIRDIPDGTQGLKCAGCDARVRKVGDHKRNSGTITVRAYLGLIKGDHCDGCRYRAQDALKNVVATSNAATGEEIFAARGDAFEYRLHVMEERLRIGDAAHKAHTDDPASQALRAEYEQTAQELTPYLRSATAIARLYARLDDDMDPWFRVAVVIRQRDGIFSWTDFCYDESRLNVLVRALNKSPKKRLGHTVACVFTAHSVTTLDSGRVRVSSTKIRFDDKTKASLSLYVAGELANRVRMNKEYVAVGQPFLGGYSEGNDVAVRMMINFRQQVAEVRRDDDQPS